MFDAGQVEKGYWVEERRQDLCHIPPSCGALWRSQLTIATLTLFDRRGLTNGRKETGTSDTVTWSFSVRIQKMLCGVVS